MAPAGSSHRLKRHGAAHIRRRIDYDEPSLCTARIAALELQPVAIRGLIAHSHLQNCFSPFPRDYFVALDLLAVAVRRRVRRRWIAFALPKSCEAGVTLVEGVAGATTLGDCVAASGVLPAGWSILSCCVIFAVGISLLLKLKFTSVTSTPQIGGVQQPCSC